MEGMEPCLGSRVELCTREGKQRGTVRYVGTVEGKEGSWVGVEWDDVSRGRHDGSHEGKRYFFCSKGGNRGSFLRPGSLDFGVTFMEAVRSKYVQREHGERDLYVHTVSEKKVKVHLVGEEDVRRAQSDTLSLERVFLNGKQVRTIDNDGSVTESVPNIRELDLSSNLLSEWNTIERIGKELKKLAVLDLSHNQLPRECPLFPEDVFPNLRVLVLNNCNMGWGTACHLAKHMPNLEELHLCENDLEAVQGGSEVERLFPNLRRMNLDDNELSDWSDLEWLGRLPSLEVLQIGGNALSEIGYDEGFPILRTIMLPRNQIRNWTSINELGRFPALKELRISGNPIMIEENRYEIIARIAGLETLNGSTVLERERKDAEIKYLRTILREGSHASAETQKKDHPRFVHLQGLYRLEKDSGIPSTSEHGSKSLAMYDITIFCPDSKTFCDRVKKRLPGTTTISRTKLLCEKLFRIPVSEQHVQVREPYGPIVFDATDDEILSSLSTGIELELLISKMDTHVESKEVLGPRKGSTTSNWNPYGLSSLENDGNHPSRNPDGCSVKATHPV